MYRVYVSLPLTCCMFYAYVYMYKLLKDYFCFTVYNTLSLEEIPDLTLVC